MDPFDPYQYISAANPVVQILAAFLLIALPIALVRRFAEDCRELGVARSIAVWGWELAFFPVMIAAVTYLGWWALGLALLWGLGPTHFDKPRATDTGQDPQR